MKFNSTPNGATMKANKQEIEKWKNNIDEYFDSLNYTKTIKELNNNLISQHMYCSENNRLIFEFHITGRIVIKTKNIDKLQILFMEKADIIVGTKLKAIEKLSPTTPLPKLSTLNIKSPSTPGKINYTTLRGQEIIFENQEMEISLERHQWFPTITSPANTRTRNRANQYKTATSCIGN